MSDTEFQAKPLTAAERLKLNISVTVVVLGVLVMGGVMLHYHSDPVSPYTASAPAAEKPVRKI